MSEPQKYLDKEKIVSMGQSCVCYNLRKASRTITRLYDEFLKPSGIQATQLSILLGTKILQPVTLKRLSKASVMDRTTLSRNLKPLEKSRLVRVEPGQDRRERIVTLTDSGEEVLTKAYPLWEHAQDKITDGLNQKGLDTLLSSLSEVVALTRSS
ncbi:winged helix-turn-helix transcriptional regulator [candidate division KSB1 bacterium]|nr:winged helix-turn-helix transcriptional regulator [candidate division KSB1 bacterium]